MANKADTIYLYWATSDDHDEDWFIFARSARQARAYHRDYEGYGENCGVAAELIMKLRPGVVSGIIPRHAQLHDLVKFGFEVLSADASARWVRLGDRVFEEGVMACLLALARSPKRARGLTAPALTL